KIAPNLGRLRLLLVDTLFVDGAFHAAFNRSVLHPFGCPYRAIEDTEGHAVVTAVCTLAEHGSRLLAMHDCLQAEAATAAGDGLVLDRAALRLNRIELCAGGEPGAERVGTVRVQAFGRPAAGAAVAVVDPETRELCAGDAVGELWVSSAGGAFWGLPKLSASIFAARFTSGGGARASSGAFLRTGLMGAAVGGRVLVFGFYEDRIRALALGGDGGPALSFHYAADINATVRRLLPQVGECAAFEMYANDTHLAVVAAEVRSGSGLHAPLADEIHAVLRARHGLSAFAVALCPAGALPRAFQYGKRAVNAQLCRHQFESGRVGCSFVRVATAGLFLNLPPPAALAAGRLPPLARWTQQTSLEPPPPPVDERSGADLGAFATIAELLAWRGAATPDAPAYVQLDARARATRPVAFAQLAARVAAAATLLLDKRRVRAGDHVLVALAPGVDFVVAVHASLAVGAVPIVVAPPDAARLAEDLPPLLAAVREFRVAAVLVDAAGDAVFRGKALDAALRVPALRALLGGQRMPPALALDRAPATRSVLGRGALRFDSAWAQAQRSALVMLFAGAQASTPRFVGFSHAALLRFCAQQKADFQMRPQLPLVASVRSYSGYGLLHCAFLGVYVGCATLVVPPPVFFAAPLVWFDLVQRHGVKDAFATLPMLQHAMSALAAAPPPRGALSLACVRNLIVATDERIDPAACAQIRDFFAPFGLDARAINPLYATQMNACISTRAYLGVPPLTLRLDPHALRRARVVAVAADAAADADGMAAGLLVLQDSGKVSGSTMVAIVDPATRMPLPAGAIGEVWVCSQSNALNRRTPLPGLSSGAVAMPMPMPAADEAATGFLATSRDCEFVRTGDLGFL
ncbi:hypothetical protein GGF37_004768, partial [Kickxella alabastrina]